MSSFKKHIQQALAKREKEGALRAGVIIKDGIDFVTNDYLGLSRMEIDPPALRAGTGASRLLGGTTHEVEGLEKQLAEFYGGENGLFFSSGYAANVGLFSCMLGRNDTYIYDEYVHASMRDGIRLSLAKSYSFKHNDTSDMYDKIARSKGRKMVVTESLFSMDGDYAPLKQMTEICAENDVAIAVDEAHATGIFGKEGRGYIDELGLGDKIDIKIITFGKALGCSGALITGSKDLISYLINFSRSFIYTTAPSPMAVWQVKHAHDLSKHADAQRKELFSLIEYFHKRVHDLKITNVPRHPGPVQIAVIPGNQNVHRVALALREKGFEVRAVLSPTVPLGMERLRICLHAFNTKEQISALVNELRYHV